MFMSTIFWIIMLLLLLAIVAARTGLGLIGGFSDVVTWILFALLGYQVFGAMIKRG